MRNAMPQQTPQQPLDASIERTKAIMQQFKGMNNPEQAIMGLLQQNPQLGSIASMVRNGNSLENIARSMAQSRGIDINQLINQLGGK